MHICQHSISIQRSLCRLRLQRRKPDCSHTFALCIINTNCLSLDRSHICIYKILIMSKLFSIKSADWSIISQLLTACALIYQSKGSWRICLNFDTLSIKDLTLHFRLCTISPDREQQRYQKKFFHIVQNYYRFL